MNFGQNCDINMTTDCTDCSKAYWSYWNELDLYVDGMGDWTGISDRPTTKSGANKKWRQCQWYKTQNIVKKYDRKTPCMYCTLVLKSRIF